MLKKILSFFICSLLCLVSIDSAFALGSVDINGTYDIHVGGYDWGAACNKVTIRLDKPLDNVNLDTFTVVEKTETFDYSQGFSGTIIKAPDTTRTVKDVKVNGNTVELELAVTASTGSPIVWSLTTQYNTYVKDYQLIITADTTNLTSNGNTVNSLTISENYSNKTTDADMFTTSSYQAKDGVNYNYASYTPTTKSDTLVVWLHGLGEGGANASNIVDRTTDPYVTTLANKVSALAGNTFQNTMNGANILVPQCPTYWMDKDGNQSNFNNGSLEADGTSYYQESLHELIASYKEKVGAKKVILAGCSNGGYMTLLMGMAYPTEYDAIVPICEAIPDTCISDEQLKGIKDLPMYFIYSKDDTTVDPTKHEIPTINRLKALGASNLHVSTTEHVVDTTNLYSTDNYNGHWSWIYFFNNESKCDDCNVKVFNWMAEQVKTEEVVDKEENNKTTAVKTGDNSLIITYSLVAIFALISYLLIKKSSFN